VSHWEYLSIGVSLSTWKCNNKIKKNLPSNRVTSLWTAFVFYGTIGVTEWYSLVTKNISTWSLLQRKKARYFSHVVLVCRKSFRRFSGGTAASYNENLVVLTYIFRGMVFVQKCKKFDAHKIYLSNWLIGGQT